jgi:hypothetical protein
MVTRQQIANSLKFALTKIALGLSMASAITFRNKAETCRSLMRHISDERTLRVLGAMIAENLAKARELECSAINDVARLMPSAQPISLAE